MTVLSCLRPCTQALRAVIPVLKCSPVIQSAPKQAGPVIMFARGTRKMPIRPGKYADKIYTDRLHLIFTIAAIPYVCVVIYSNLFMSFGELADIPEGYVPQSQEYYQHPISRFLQEYIIRSPEKMYETYMHVLHYQDEKARARLLRRKVEKVMMDRQDVRGWYFFQSMSDEKEVTAKQRKPLELKF